MPLPPSLLEVLAATETGMRVVRGTSERFRGALHDAERIPRKGGALLVGNHALFGLDSIVLSALIIAETGRTPRFLAERFLFRIPGMTHVLRGVGAIPGSPDEAVRMLEEGELVAVYPGGVDDSFKLSTEAYTLKWGTRAGFAKVAMRARVPIVPIAATGIDELFDVTRREATVGRRLLGSARYDLPVPRSLRPRDVPLDYFVLPAIETAGDVGDAEAVERVRRGTYEAIEEVLAGYRARG